MATRKDKIVGIKVLFWAITPEASDDEARAAYAKKFKGQLPATILVHGPVKLCGPVIEEPHK